jgi:hypothetical protein
VQINRPKSSPEGLFKSIIFKKGLQKSHVLKGILNKKIPRVF